MQYIVQKSHMHPNTKLLHDFYLAFQDKNHSGMQACYAEDAHFSDPVFQNLNTLQVRKMWEMLVTRGKDLQIVFSDIEADDQKGKAHWVATYTFSQTGKKVVNDINATFEFENGRIKKHRDDFDFAHWCKQALGLKGKILGSTAFMQNQVKKGAMTSLDRYIEKTK